MDSTSVKLETAPSRVVSTRAIYADSRKVGPAWSPAKRRWRIVFAILVFFGIYAAVCFVFPGQRAGLAIGWIPASICAAVGYHDPLLLVQLIFGCLAG